MYFYGGPLDGEQYNSDKEPQRFLVFQLSRNGIPVDLFSMYEYEQENNRLKFVETKTKEQVMKVYEENKEECERENNEN